MFNEKKCLLIIGGGVEQQRAYEIAHEMGLAVVGSDKDLKAPSLALADYIIRASTRDAAETVEAAKKFNHHHAIHGVMTLANDVPLTVATVAEELGLPGISVEAAKIASDKILMKQAFSRVGIPIPEFREIHEPGELEMIVKDWGFPIVLKPVDGRGARGVLKITPSVDLLWAYKTSLENSDNKRVIAERFVDGPQLSTESMVYNDHCYTVSVSARNYEFMNRYAPYIIENGGVLPTDLPCTVVKQINDMIALGAKAMGIKKGPVKGDVVIGENGPLIIELAARLSGGYLCTDQIPMARDVDLVKQTILLALGSKLDIDQLIPKELCYVGVRYFFPEPGRIVSIKGFDELDNEEWVVKKKLFVQIGDVVKPVIDHTKRVGFLHVSGRSEKEAEARAVDAANRVVIKTMPE